MSHWDPAFMQGSLMMPAITLVCSLYRLSFSPATVHSSKNSTPVKVGEVTYCHLITLDLKLGIGNR